MSVNRSRFVHLLEQAEGVLHDIAPSLVRYYDRLVSLGMPPAQAIVLVREVQNRYLGGAAVEEED